MAIQSVGIVGAGKMSTEIFELLNKCGFGLVLYSPFPEEIAAADEKLLDRLRRRASKGGSRGEEAEARLSQITLTTDMNALRDSDLIIEAVVENIAIKRKVIRELDEIARPDAIIATNTSSLSPTSIFSATSRPERCAGLHYFFPVSLVTCVEVAPTRRTSPAVTAELIDFVRRTRRHPIVVQEVNGYLINRMLVTYYNEGATVVREGHWLPGQVDAIAKRFAAVGPLEGVDYVGVDVILGGAESLDESWGRVDHVHKQARGHARWPRMYYQLRTDGRLGRKTGVGFYRYENNQAVEDPEYFRNACQKLNPDGLPPASDEDQVERRLFYALVLEAILSFERGIGTKEDIDLALKEILGLEHGVFGHIDLVGVESVREIALDLEAKVGWRFAPLGFLRRADEPPTPWEEDDLFTMGR